MPLGEDGACQPPLSVPADEINLANAQSQTREKNGGKSGGNFDAGSRSALETNQEQEERPV
jgi:hypothetical protein